MLLLAFLSLLCRALSAGNESASARPANSSRNGTANGQDAGGGSEISYGIFAFLFAVFVIFLLLGLFFFVERVFCKHKRRLTDCFRFFLNSGRALRALRRRKQRQVRPLRRRKDVSRQSENQVWPRYCASHRGR